MVEAGLSRAQVAAGKNPRKAAEVAKSRVQVAPRKKKSLGQAVEAETDLVQAAPDINPTGSIRVETDGAATIIGRSLSDEDAACSPTIVSHSKDPIR